MNKKYKKVLVEPDISIKAALKKMNESGHQILVVVDQDEKVLGIITDGDIRRGLIKNTSLDEPIKKIMNRNPIILRDPCNDKEAIKLMKKYSIKHIPILDDRNRLIDIKTLASFINNGKLEYEKKDIPVVIIAGGKGTRLDPFTRILPKPLIPLGGKPIIEIIIDRFRKYGFNRFLISVNYKRNMIKAYFLEKKIDYDIDYVEENRYLGTAGAIVLAKNKLKDTFIVSNCDIITDANYDDLLNYHRDNKSHATILAVIRNFKIPYGVLKYRNRFFECITEKPEYSFLVNAGVYVLEPDIFRLLKREGAINMTELLMLAKKNKLRVMVYPVNCRWFDVGEWDEYKKAVEYIEKAAY
jgi:dTDP-glucose pyrophosphorylase